MTNICRTCLQIIENQSDMYKLDTAEPNVELLTLGQKLAACVPELMLDVTVDAVVCWSCATALRCAYGFKQQCLESENKIESYLKKTHSSSIKDLNLILQDNLVVEGVCEKEPVIVLCDSTENPPLPVEQNAHVAFTNCQSDFRTPKPYSGSILKELLKDKPYKCRHCDYQTIKASKFEIHKRIHPEEQKCDQCNFTTKNKEHFAIHMKIHRATETYRCHLCSYETPFVTHLEAHAEIHWEDATKRRRTCV